MKRLTALACTLPLLISPVSAKEPAESSAAHVDFLLYRGLDEHQSLIRQEAQTLDYATRVGLFTQHRQQHTEWFMIANFLSPIAIGSMGQGDSSGAWWISGLKLGASALGGLAVALYPRTGSNESWQIWVALPLMAGALGLGIWGFVGGINRPFAFAQAQDQKLIEILGLNSPPTLSWSSSPNSLKWSF